MAELAARLSRFPRERTWLLPALQAIQESERFLSPEAMEAVSAHLRVPKSEVYGVATHYPEFRLTKPGARLIRVCTGPSCRILGSLDLLHILERTLGITARQTAPDGLATLEEMDCGFVCGIAPVVEVNHEYRGRVRLSEVPALLETSRAPAEVVPSVSKPAAPAGKSAQERWSDLKRQADARRVGARLVVGMGSCGLAVGAGELIAALSAEVERRRLPARVIAGGCNGMCFAAPAVEILKDGWPRITVSGVTSETAPRLIEALATGDGLAGLAAVNWSDTEWQGIPPLSAEPFLSGQQRALIERCGIVDPGEIADAIRHGSYAHLARVLDEGGPDRVIEEVRASGLQGRGGAYFQAVIKWEACRKGTGEPKYLVMNGEEGEPGIFKDRHLMEGDPHRLLEGVLLAAYAAGATRGYLYVHGEANLSARRLAKAVEEAESWGLLGEQILGSNFSLHLELRRGAGGFVLGEETALLESIEGKRAMPRVRPPFPVEAGLWGKPTVINNVETLFAVPLIVEKGGAWFAGLGLGRGTKLFGLSGHVAKPGIVEVELGVTLRQLIEQIGGGLRSDRPLKAVLVGGPSGSIVHPRQLDDPLIPRGPVNPGTGGVVAMDESASVRDIARTLLAFNTKESCGKCTPCREGTARMLEMLDRQRDPERLPAQLREMSELVQVASLCGLGQAAPFSILSGLNEFPHEMLEAVSHQPKEKREFFR
jgi:NADH:ubiquinone oxidoreductase subunit F (NADH-binding)/NADH:ubiquinone oxidoreductase subunit E